MASHVAAAERYAREVAAGTVPACKWVRLACQRHLDDLIRQKDRAWPYRFDRKRAERVCRFIELLPHTKGEWARRRETIRLEPWQNFKTAVLFGWVRKRSKRRRFRKALILEPRKNAKSTWAAAIGLYMLTADGEHGAEIYSGATTEKQAWEVFRPARLMALRSPGLLSHFGVTVNASNLHILGNGSRFEPLIGKPGDGASPSCSIHDEYHEHQTDEQVGTMETGMGAREQPLLLIITTAGDNLAGPCYAAVQDAQRMLDGVTANDEFFALMYGVDPTDDWTTEAALIKANPNYGVSVHADFLRSQQREAINSARKAGTFKTKHLNMWVQARNAYFNIQRWHESADPSLKLEDFAGQPCRIGLDLASKVDIAAIELIFRHKGGYARFGRYYLPKDTIEEGQNEHYQGWVAEGRIIETDGNMIDYVAIREDILDLTRRFQVEQVAYDPHQALMMVSELIAEGVPCIEVRPLVLNFSEPMKTMDALIRERKIVHDGDPVFTWMLSNVVAKEDAKDNVYPRKDRPENKIDGPVAHIMALATLLKETAPEQSIYETRGLATIGA